MSICFSPDNRRIVSGSRDDTLRVWDIETGATLLGPLEGHSHRVLSVVFSPDNRYIVSGSYNGTVGIWNAETGAIVSNLLVGHAQSLTSVAVSPDGSIIASSSWDSTVRIWSVRTATADPEASITAFRLNPSAIPLSTGFLAHYANSSGWVTSDDGALLLWLPKDRRHADDS
ncbi:WD40 repeat-like protein, partial [Ceratobasidium sp. AG-I]